MSAYHDANVDIMTSVSIEQTILITYDSTGFTECNNTGVMMSITCCQCQQRIEQNPSLFTFNSIVCSKCGIELRTNIKSRLLFVLSFGGLASYHLYMKANGSESNQVVIWAGLASIMLPIIFTLFANRYERGEQKAAHSTIVNIVFFLMIFLLIYLWLSSY